MHEIELRLPSLDRSEGNNTRTAANTDAANSPNRFYEDFRRILFLVDLPFRPRQSSSDCVTTHSYVRLQRHTNL